MTSRAAEVRQLQALSVLAQELHFGRAAHRLNMTQPALSQLVRDFEERLGFRLLERTTRRVLLTGPGKSFLIEAEAILRHLDQAVESARAEAGHASNRIRIGAILPTSFEFLPGVLSKFRHRYPNADVHIETKESQQLLTSLETGTLHVALLRPPKKAGTLRMETVRRETFVAAMRMDHPVAKLETIRLADLRTERIIRIVRGDLRDAFEDIDRELAAVGLKIEQCQVADTTLTALALVSAGDGISLVPSWTVGLPWKEVCFRQVVDLRVSIDLAVAWEKTNLPSIAQHFIDIARRATV